MHGTRLNDRSLKPHTQELLIDNDTLRFGAEVFVGAGMWNPFHSPVSMTTLASQSGKADFTYSDFFPPLDMSVSFEWLSYAHPPGTPSRPRNTFTAEYSDDESDEDEFQARVMARQSSVGDSENSEDGSASSFVESEEDGQYEVNTSPSSPAGLTDAEKQ